MDDLVASLKLQIQNELSAGLEEAKGDFGELTSDVDALRASLSGVDEMMAAVAMPSGLQEGLASLNSGADDLLDAWQQIGIQIDTDTASIRNMSQELDGVLAQMADAQAAAGRIVPVGGGGGGDVPPIVPPGPNDPNDPDDPARPGGGHAGEAVTNVIMAGVAAAVAKDAAEKYAAFDQILYQTAIKEGFNSDDAGGEVSRLTTLLDNMAVKTGNSSSDLAEAYYYLVTTGMNKQLIGQLMPSVAMDATAYGNTPMEDAQTVFTLNGVLGIGPDQMQQGLSIISKAAQLGHFGVGDFGNYLPGLGAQLSILQDTGIGGEVQVASALEATRKVSGTSEQDAIDMQDLITYLASPTAARYFDRTKRSQDLLGAPILDLFKKYHIDGINIPEYLDDKEAHGEGSFDAMMDLSRLIETKLPANASGSDVREIFGALFHNQQAATAALGIAQNYDVFKQNEATLYGVNDNQVQGAFNTSINSPQGQVNIVDEQFAEMTRTLGSNVLPSLTLLGNAANLALGALNGIGELFSKGFATPVGTDVGTTAAYLAHFIKTGQWKSAPAADNGYAFSGRQHSTTPQPINLTVNIDKSGYVTASAKPGFNPNIDQGLVVGTSW